MGERQKRLSRVSCREEENERKKKWTVGWSSRIYIFKSAAARFDMPGTNGVACMLLLFVPSKLNRRLVPAKQFRVIVRRRKYCLVEGLFPWESQGA